MPVCDRNAQPTTLDCAHWNGWCSAWVSSPSISRSTTRLQACPLLQPRTAFPAPTRPSQTLRMQSANLAGGSRNLGLRQQAGLSSPLARHWCGLGGDVSRLWGRHGSSQQVLWASVHLRQSSDNKVWQTRVAVFGRQRPLVQNSASISCLFAMLQFLQAATRSPLGRCS